MFNNMNAGFFKTHGIGLGLTTARALTNILQGAIHLNSEVGGGTEVGFSVLTSKKSRQVNSKDLKAEMYAIKDEVVCQRLKPTIIRFSSGRLEESGS